jgi:hypothetical protein
MSFSWSGHGLAGGLDGLGELVDGEGLGELVVGLGDGGAVAAT